MQTRILWIEGKRAEGLTFTTELQKKGYELDIVPSGNAALARLALFDPHLVVVHAASMRTSGKRICRAVRESMNGIPILVISDPQLECRDICANVVLKLPFTPRKLLNRIKPLIQDEGKKLLHKGPLRLDLENRKVQIYGRETHLTPRLTQILHMLMINSGVVIQRDQLFRKIWNTEYLGDTRTLDVHINWLRKIIEEDARNPKLLITLRGVGYRLDV